MNPTSRRRTKRRLSNGWYQSGPTLYRSARRTTTHGSGLELYLLLCSRASSHIAILRQKTVWR